jgi:hypothetical protein
MNNLILHHVYFQKHLIHFTLIESKLVNEKFEEWQKHS